MTEREIISALKEQARHVASLRSGLGTSDAIQSHDELVMLLVEAAKESNRKEMEEKDRRIAELGKYQEAFAAMSETRLAESERFEATINDLNVIIGMQHTKLVANQQTMANMIDCEWTQNKDGIWETDCGNMFVINEGSPSENDLKFCPYCGKSLVESIKEPK